MSKKKKRPPELTAEETAAIMKVMVDHQVISERINEMAAEIMVKPQAPPYTIPVYTKVQNIRVQTSIGKPWGNKRCPVWLPQDPNVLHKDRKQCVKVGPHSEHSSVYVIEEQTLE